jgi:hypothetical protein
VARRAEHRDPVSGLHRESHQTASGSAAGQETTPHALPADAHTPASTTSAVGPARARRLTSRHLAKSQNLGTKWRCSRAEWFMFSSC